MMLCNTTLQLLFYLLFFGGGIPISLNSEELDLKLKILDNKDIPPILNI